MERIYYFPKKSINSIMVSAQIRWLKNIELDVFNRHLALCGQKECPIETWSSVINEGTSYCGYFIDNKMIARAAVEKYSPQEWEVADVRVVREFRNSGYAKQVCLFVVQYILSNGKIATIRTENDNAAMRAVIRSLGFQAKE